MSATATPQPPALARLADKMVRNRRRVLVVWSVFTLIGMFAAQQMNDRWFQSFSIPGYPAYETNQTTLTIFGNGEQPPLVAVFTAKGDVRKRPEIEKAISAAAFVNYPARYASYFVTHDEAYVSRGHRTTFATMYPPGLPSFSFNMHIKAVRAVLKRETPKDVTVHLTGRDPLFEAAAGDAGGTSIVTEVLIGAVGCLVILFFVFGTLPAVLMPIAVALAAILNTYTVVYLVSFVTEVSIIVQYLIALVGLGIAIDYSLLVLFRFRDELREGRDVESATVETMTHAGRSVVVSGSTVAVGLLSMIVIPLPFIRSIGLGGMLIPAASVLAAVTLLPALLVTVGTRVNDLRLLPKRLVDTGHPEDGWWGRWGRLVLRRPIAVAAVGLAIVGALLYAGSQLKAGEARIKDYPGSGDAVAGRQALFDAGITPSVFKPLIVLVGPTGNPESVAIRLRSVRGVTGAVAPFPWRQGSSGLVEVFIKGDPAAHQTSETIKRVRFELEGVDASLGGVAPEDRDFAKAVYTSFPYVVALVVLFTLVLLTRAFRSVVLAVKAVILNLISLGAAYGVIVLVFQKGYGSDLLWGIHATDAVIPWIPLMIFAFLYGLSMDYEVFMLTRMREAYDETHDTEQAIALGLARTGKLVTSAALILMFAFFVLTLTPGLDVKQFALGLAAGIVLDATVIRVLLVPALMRLLGTWNWWLPRPLARALFLQTSAEAA